MGSLRNIFELVVSLPVRALDPILSAESDWIRYGVPAVVLTVIFFILMRTQAPSTGSSVPPPSEAVQQRQPLHFGPKPFSATPQPAGNIPEVAANNPAPISEPPVAPTNEVVSQPAPASGSFGQMQGGGTPQQIAARLALCNAVRFAATRPAQARNRLAMTMAMQTYRGPGGAEASRDAIMQAMAEYRRGVWSDEQCPTPMGTTPLRHGMIGGTIK